MIKKYCIVVLAFFCTACASSISGHLKGANGEIIKSSEARVNISSLDKGEKDSTVIVVPVDDKGSFSSKSGLADGKYLIEALVPGYSAASTTIDLKNSKEIDLVLVPAKSPRTTTINANEDPDVGKGSGGATVMPPQL